MNYYNEYDKFAAAWLRELIKEGLIPDGHVDERSITEVDPKDLKDYTQCHFFAGIAGWSLALQLAGWPTDRPVWTGSPPCQPFSTAGKQRGKDDERHLWPVFFNLIRECKPSAVFGEQVASAIRHGWFDDLQTDLEKEGYASAMAVLPACSVGAYHKRERLFYVANLLSNTGSKGLEGFLQARDNVKENRARKTRTHGDIADICRDTNFSLVDTNSDRCEQGSKATEAARQGNTDDSASWNDSSLGYTECDGSHGLEVGRSTTEASDNDTQRENIPCESTGTSRSEVAGDLRHWDDATVIYCRDGKYRPIPTEPSLQPLANGVSNRVGLLRGAGNAIVPQVAAEFIKAYMEIVE